MAEEGSMAVVVIGYILALVLPILGLIVGAVLYFWKKDEVPLYATHGKYIMIVALVMVIIFFILISVLGIALLPALAAQ